MTNLTCFFRAERTGSFAFMFIFFCMINDGIVELLTKSCTILVCSLFSSSFSSSNNSMLLFLNIFLKRLVVKGVIGAGVDGFRLNDESFVRGKWVESLSVCRMTFSVSVLLFFSTTSTLVLPRLVNRCSIESIKFDLLVVNGSVLFGAIWSGLRSFIKRWVSSSIAWSLSW